MTSRQDRGFTAVELVIVILVLGLVAAVALPALLRGARNSKIAECSRRLSTLWKAQSDFAAKTGRPPAGRGGAYWLELTQGPSPLVAPGADALFCPLAGETPRDGATSWRGPGADPTPFPAKAPLGADRSGNHGAREGGHVLLKEGAVQAFRELEGYWQEAERLLRP